MWPNPQFPADLVTFTAEILNGKLHFLCSINQSLLSKCSANMRCFVQFGTIYKSSKMWKHQWKSFTFSKVEGVKSNTPRWVFFTFFNLYKWCQIAQSITYWLLNLVITRCIVPYGKYFTSSIYFATRFVTFSYTCDFYSKATFFQNKTVIYC